MSKIEDLIREYCPDGVPYRSMGEIGTFTRGRRFVKDDISDTGTPCIHYGEMYTHYGVWAKEAKSYLSRELASKLRVAHPGDVIIVAAGETIEDIGKGVAWLGDDDVVIHDACYIFSHSLDPKFVSYFLRTKTFHSQITRHISSGKISSISAKGLEKAKIPIPPLAVQKEIVNILDKFIQLDAELSVELDVRRKQYDYYRNRLFTFNESNKRARWLTLDEVCKFISAGGDLPKNFKKGQLGPSEELPYPIFSNGSDGNALYGYTDSYKVDEEAISISARGTIGFHAIRAPKFTPIVRLLTLIPDNSTVTTKYLNYALDITEIGHSGGSIPQLTVPNVKKIKIPIPSIGEQDKITDILDKFDALTSNIYEGLPAEINARRQQYEYYRNKLLTFDELHA